MQKKHRRGAWRPVMWVALLTALGLVPIIAFAAFVQGADFVESVKAQSGIAPAQPAAFAQGAGLAESGKVDMEAASIQLSAAAKKGDDGTTNWDFIQPVTHKKTVPAGYTAIRSAKDLDKVRNDLGGDYILMANIDLKSWGNWVPIGSWYFGTFDGNGYVIQNMTVAVEGTSGSVFAGLFGRCSGGTIKNLGILGGNVSASASAEAMSYAGGIAGEASSPIINCYNAASVSASAYDYCCSYTGGIAGVSNSSISSCYNTGAVSAFADSPHSDADAGGIAGVFSVISNCYNAGTVSAAAAAGTVHPIAATSGSRAGGIAGVSAFDGTPSICTISSNYNTGAVSASAADLDAACAGGIAGYANHSSAISNCYNAGAVSALAHSFSYAGGIAGRSLSASSISSCYNRGAVKAASQISDAYRGGIAGSNSFEASAKNCYYQNDTAADVGESNGGTLTNVYVLTASQMKQQAFFSGFDFSTVWVMGASGYPQLRSFHVHTPGAWKTVAAATAAKAGKQEQRCTECGAVVAAKVLPANHSIKLSRSSVTLGKGEKYKPTATTSVKTTVSWSSNKTSAATVDSAGNITAKAAGTATITAKTAGGRTASITVTVKPAPTSIKASPASVTLGAGEKYTIKTTLNSGAASYKKTYKSGSSAIAAVDANGKVTAKKAGTANITVTTFNGKKTTFKVTVKAAPTSIKATPAGVTLGVKESCTIKTTLNSGAASCKKTYKSSNEAIAAVDANGKVTAKKAGTTSITVTTFNGKKTTFKVTVKAAPASVKLSSTKLTLNKGKTAALKAALAPSGAASYAKSWTSSDSKIAKVDANGKVTAVKKGTAAITCRTFNGKTAKCLVTVR